MDPPQSIASVKVKMIVPDGIATFKRNVFDWLEASVDEGMNLVVFTTHTVTL